ncbi:beta-lactamase/transpeptidase-like protein [Phanerochaete sordida]|uniref:Beta-lactamase/transpeptidase-like protein n=1 Tax=Phanerochaete sordida TaxID=48140 RepID=A0A9P3LGU2_9APHY|nr:beta-lactamase/transpeptidase-like protein [Phanerochaete sordida]
MLESQLSRLGPSCMAFGRITGTKEFPCGFRHPALGSHSKRDHAHYFSRMRFIGPFLASLVGAVLCQQQVLHEIATAHLDVEEHRVITPELAAFVETLIEDNNVPGMTLGVVHSNGTIELGAFGRRTEDGDAITVDTQFIIASCSKAFLASAMGILIDDFAQGRNKTPLPAGVQQLDWHTKVVGLFPNDWGLMDEWASEKVTVRDILSHQSGLPRHEMSYRRRDKPIDVVRRMRHLRPAFELRERWHYNNQLYTLGAHILSTYAAMPYTEFVEERIWKRLDMSSTTFSPDAAARGGRLTQAWTSGGRRIPIWFNEAEIDLHAGYGGIISNVVDMTKWTQMLLNWGADPVTNHTIVPREAFDTMTRSHSIVSSRPESSWFSTETYGIGWIMKSYQGHNLLTHSGSIPGFSAEVLLLPDSGLGIVTLANGANKHDQELAIIYRIVEDFLGLEHRESERLIAEASKAQPHKPFGDPHPENAAPLTLPLEAYTGTYHDAGYGTLTFCAPGHAPPAPCAELLQTWAAFENTTDATRRVLYATIDSVWVSTLRLEHAAGERFAVDGTRLFPMGYGADVSPFRSESTGETVASAEFVVEDGEDGPRVVGVALNDLVKETTKRHRLGATVEQTAEVWLAKV